MGITLNNLIYHVIFSTKDREAAIIPEIRDELHRYLGGIVKGEGRCSPPKNVMRWNMTSDTFGR